MMILWFFSIFGGQIQKSIRLKCCTLIDFMICPQVYFAIHCPYKLWTGMMIFRFFPISRHINAPWWPNAEINITEMLYPDRFHDLAQVFNSLCTYVNYEQERWNLENWQIVSFFTNKDGRQSAILNQINPFLAHLGGLLRWLCGCGPSSVDGITFWWKFSEREELGLPNLAWPCIPIGGTYTPKIVLIRSKMAVWRPFWMPKSHFLIHLTGSFRSHVSYKADSW